MKSKLLLVLSLAFLLCCFFAISVSAEVVISESNLDENGDIVADVLLDLGDSHHLLSVDMSYTDVNGEIKNGKLYYETSYWSARSMRQMKYTYIPADFDFSQTVYFFDKADFNGDGSYAGNELIKLYEGGGGSAMYTYESYDNDSFTETADAKPYLEAVSYSKYFVKFADKGFGAKAPKLSAVTYNGHELVENTLIISSLIDEIFSGSFGGDGSSLQSNSFVPAFTRLVFEDREGSVSFGQYCFTRVAVEEIIFGSGTYNLVNKERIALVFSKNYPADATLKRIVVDSDTVLANGTISWNVGTYDVVFVGTQAEYDLNYAANCEGALACADRVIVDSCYYGHTEVEDDGDCTTALVCPACLTYIYKEAMSHNNNERVTYESYFENGMHYAGCCNEGCTVGEAKEIDALIVSVGYSASTYGDTVSVVQGFVINKEAIEYYGKYNDTLEIGAVAFANSTGEAITPDFDNEKVISGKISLVNAYVDVCVKGITDKIGENRVALCLYIVDDTGMHFLNENKTENSVLGISYSEILELSNK